MSATAGGSQADDATTKVATLTCMGFSEDDAMKALDEASWNVDYAVNILLSRTGQQDTFVFPTDNSSLSKMVLFLAALSQYDFPEGQSACTCLALAMADTILKDNALSSESLTSSLYQGYELYVHYQQQQQQQRHNNNNATTTRHTSAEELLHLFPNLHLMMDDNEASGIRQGLLTDDGSCWKDLLASPIFLDSNNNNKNDDGQEEKEQQQQQGIAYCITKPPETILVYISTTPRYFWLVDSHCRPPQLEQAYAQRYDSWDGLLAALQSLFPATPNIPGVSPIQMAMYNSVDVYPLRRRK